MSPRSSSATTASERRARPWRSTTPSSTSSSDRGAKRSSRKRSPIAWPRRSSPPGHTRRRSRSKRLDGDRGRRARPDGGAGEHHAGGDRPAGDDDSAEHAPEPPLFVNRDLLD